MRMNFQALCEAANEDATLFLENAPFEEEEEGEDGDAAHFGPEEGVEEDVAVACSLRLEPINPPQLCNLNALAEVAQEDGAMEVIGRRPPRGAQTATLWGNSTLGNLLPKMGDQGAGAMLSLQDFCRRITACLHPPLKPLQPPSQTGQLYYEVFIEGSPIRALFDPGASHSFIWEEWARTQRLTYTPLDPPRAVGVFNGEKEYVRYVAHVKKFSIAGHVRPWNFYVIGRSPTPIVVGLDAVRAMPLFYNPLDDCLYAAPELGRPYGDLGGRYRTAERELRKC